MTAPSARVERVRALEPRRAEVEPGRGVHETLGAELAVGQRDAERDVALQQRDDGVR
ncbi:MAG: hypothetical protein HXY24_07445, partial [Rubrivivax sp.]|nr:hypothetical protein [Rubrivivax sp.]